MQCLKLIYVCSYSLISRFIVQLLDKIADLGSGFTRLVQSMFGRKIVWTGKDRISGNSPDDNVDFVDQLGMQ